MTEEKIIITINDDGSLEVKSDGIKGEKCVGEIEKLLENIAEIKDAKKTDEYYQKEAISQRNVVSNKG